MKDVGAGTVAQPARERLVAAAAGVATQVSEALRTPATSEPNVSTGSAANGESSEGAAKAESAVGFEPSQDSEAPGNSANATRVGWSGVPGPPGLAALYAKSGATEDSDGARRAYGFSRLEQGARPGLGLAQRLLQLERAESLAVDTARIEARLSKVREVNEALEARLERYTTAEPQRADAAQVRRRVESFATFDGAGATGIRPGALGSLGSVETSLAEGTRVKTADAGTEALYGVLGQVGPHGFPSAHSVSVLRASLESHLTGGLLNFLS